MTPKRIQRSRAKGWRMPDGAVYVGRPSRWGNPFTVNEYGARLAVDNYRRRIVGMNISELRGKDLACWCRLDEPCHADVLLELAK